MTKNNPYTVSIALEAEVSEQQALPDPYGDWFLWKRDMEKTDPILSRQKWCNQFSKVRLFVHSLGWVLAAIPALGVIFTSGQHCCYAGGDFVVSHSLLWRPWVTVRVSESLSDISFLNFILNAIFYRSLKHLGCLVISD